MSTNGVDTFIIFGNCGVLDKKIEDCSIIIPNKAFRDEGTSYHYLQDSESIEMNKKYKNLFKQVLDENGYKYEEGATWTTDGFYRETKEKLEIFKQKGAVCVEMEGASIAAVCEYKKLKYFTFYYAGDNLDAVEWEERSLGQLTSFEKKARVPYLAFELARKIELCSEWERKKLAMKVLIGTNNKGKVEGAKQAFEKFYENVKVVGVSVNSGVSDEPVNDEIYQGASNRVNNLIKYAEDNNVGADFFIGVESGITNKLGKWCIIQIAVIKDKNGYESFGTGPAFPVPDKYVKEIIDTDLGIVMDKIFNGNGLKNEKGGIAHLTKDVVTRYDLTREAFIMALTEFINGDIWRD